MRSPGGGRCITCGREFGAEPHYITRMPDGEHLRCRDWSRELWPLAELEERLRRRWRALRSALAAVESLGRYLRERRRMWPAGAAETMLAIDDRVREIDEALERAGLRRVRR